MNEVADYGLERISEYPPERRDVSATMDASCTKHELTDDFKVKLFLQAIGEANVPTISKRLRHLAVEWWAVAVREDEDPAEDGAFDLIHTTLDTRCVHLELEAVEELLELEKQRERSTERNDDTSKRTSVDNKQAIRQKRIVNHLKFHLEGPALSVRMPDLDGLHVLSLYINQWAPSVVAAKGA